MVRQLPPQTCLGPAFQNRDPNVPWCGQQIGHSWVSCVILSQPHLGSVIGGTYIRRRRTCVVSPHSHTLARARPPRGAADLLGVGRTLHTWAAVLSVARMCFVSAAKVQKAADALGRQHAIHPSSGLQPPCAGPPKSLRPPSHKRGLSKHANKHALAPPLGDASHTTTTTGF